ncbi:MAG: CPBP family intramembrane metalloprotease [Novosphingobium sp.]|nr:CPBP family intramembrane metalloprotease [Novosphingobium sp.]
MEQAEAVCSPERRLRRFVAHPLSLLVIGWTCVILATVAANVVLRLLTSVTVRSPLTAAGGAAAAILAFKGYKRWIERAPDRELEGRGAVPEVVAGLAFGFALFSAMTAAVAALGGIEIAGVRGWGQIWAMLALAIFSGPFEEILFRGIALRQLERLVGTWGALALTSAFFGAAHLANAGATWFAALAIAMEAGVLLGAAYLLTRRLWLAIGIHSGWNFTQGWVFSIPVSGGRAPLGLLVTRRIGPEWLTGGAFGLEASGVAMVVATAAGVALLWWAARFGRIVPFGTPIPSRESR